VRGEKGQNLLKYNTLFRSESESDEDHGKGKKAKKAKKAKKSKKAKKAKKHKVEKR